MSATYSLRRATAISCSARRRNPLSTFSASSALRSASVARTACQVLTVIPASSVTAMAPQKFLQEVNVAGRAGQDHVAVEKTLHVRGQVVGCRVAPRAILLQRL